MAILITDAPPHGIGEYGDGFPAGSPDMEDPIRVVRAMSEQGIVLYVVACEPALSGYQYALDFYQGLVAITGGMLVPLTTASLLSHVVIAAAGEVMDFERLHKEVGDAVLERMRSLSLEKGGDSSSDLMDQVALELHEKLLLRNECTKQLVIESIYRESEEASHNVYIWSHAPDLTTARPHIRKVIGSRLSQKYLDARRSKTSSSPSFHMSPVAPSTPRSQRSESSTRTIADFTAFKARPGMRFAQETKSNTQALGAQGYRQTAANDMDDDDDAFSSYEPVKDTPTAREVQYTGDDGQLFAYREDQISLNQAKRLALQSVSRIS